MFLSVMTLVMTLWCGCLRCDEDVFIVTTLWWGCFHWVEDIVIVMTWFVHCSCGVDISLQWLFLSWKAGERGPFTLGTLVFPTWSPLCSPSCTGSNAPWRLWKFHNHCRWLFVGVVSAFLQNMLILCLERKLLVLSASHAEISGILIVLLFVFALLRLTLRHWVLTFASPSDPSAASLHHSRLRQIHPHRHHQGEANIFVD